MADSGQALLIPSDGGRRSSRDGDRLHVVLLTEGTYPHFRGGVSTWCEALMRGLPEIDFTVWALMMNPFISSQYVLPDNATSFVGVPLWGIEEPVEYTSEVPAAKVIYLSRRTREDTARTGFVPLLEELLREIASPEFDPGRFGHLLYRIHLYFRDNDYRSTFRSRATWDAMTRLLIDVNEAEAADEDEEGDLADHSLPDASPERGPSRDEARSMLRKLLKPPPAKQRDWSSSGDHVPSLNDATEALQWLYRLLMPLNVPIPDGDVVHSSAAGFCAIPAILAKIERGTPFLLTEHGVYMREQYLAMGRQGFPYFLKKILIQMVAAMSRTAFHFADQISPVCEFNARWELRNGADRDRIRVIYNGVDPSVYSPRSVDRTQEPTVVMVARIDPLKDFETFLRVADRVRQTVPNVRFLQYGPSADPEYDQKIRKLHKELKLDGTVEFMGATDSPADSYNRGDVVLLTSISEAFPYAVIEAMMCGKPVVSTDVGGVREALENVGILARAGDVEALAAGVIQLLNLDEQSRVELSGANRERALNLFTIRQALDAYSTTYTALGEAYRKDLGSGLIDVAALDHSELRLEDPVVVEAEPLAAGAEIVPAEEPRPPVPPPVGIDAASEPVGVDAVQMFFDPDPEVRRKAVSAAISRFGISRADAMRNLAVLVSSDPDPSVRRTAATALASLLAGEGR